jgi:metal-dependent HD superfamily phosphatase/phosphodiesterase
MCYLNFLEEIDMIQQLIDWLNGKKTVIGASVLAVYAFLTQIGVHLPSITQNEVVAWINNIVILLGAILWVVGLIHKAIKWFQEQKIAKKVQ